ncbi:sugar porter family MFS transporter [Amnibacterium flavum]|uniref:MFS transporter n=1 Tax=Amnibacterium flavum TaxID=2173173 RepID=A0A2V1HXR2_9MICO|nr:sugar porter family MFS transporter [Amnibacterium flavum]PVZ96130.1 MFS transporter [Amnibacterium flavum]
MAQTQSSKDAAQVDPKFRRRVYALAIAAAVGGFLFGFDSSVINGAVDAIGEQFGLTAFIQGFAVAIALLGCALGAYIAGSLADRLGRLKVMLIGAILFFVSSVGAGFAFGVIDFMFWRVIGGLGIGVASVIAPTYIAEVVPALVRGRLASFQQLAITLGIFAALLSDAVLAGFDGKDGASQILLGIEAWRWMFVVGVIPSLVYGILALRLPESPRYLLDKGRTDEAKKVLSTVLPGDEVEPEIDRIAKAIEEDKENQKKASLRGKALGLAPVVWIGLALSVFQQFVGINVIFYYSTTLWNAVGFKDSFLISVISSVINVAVTFIAIAFVDKVGRRPMLLAGSAGMAITLALMAISFSQAETTDGAVSLPQPWGIIALIAANGFVVAFGATWGPLVWVLLGEIFPNRIRAKALGLAASAQWIANFLITVSFPSISEISLVLAYGLYAAFAALSLIFVFFFVPETKGVKLEDVGGLVFGRAKKAAARS